MARRLISMAGIALAISGCLGEVTVQERRGPGAGGPGSGEEEESGPPGSTADIYSRLKPSCVGCHGSGTNKPHFASLAAFETLLVRNRKYIQAGSPSSSGLIALLQGGYDGAYPQMPTSGDSFATLAGKGKTAITMEELEVWIGTLVIDPTTAPTVPVQVSSLRRKTAEQLLSSLRVQLGLSASDVSAEDAYPVTSPDAAPRSYLVQPSDMSYSSLGGANWLRLRKPNNLPSPVFAQQFAPMVQAWCRIAVNKSPSALLVAASLPDRTDNPTGRARVEKNLATLHLKMLGVPASPEEAAELLGLFQNYEPQGTVTAWTAICAALVRHPLWVTY